MFNPLIAFLVFLSAMVYDVFYTWMIIFTEKKKPLMAAHMSGLAGVCSIIAWSNSIFHITKYAPFMIAGWWTGTYLGVKFDLANIINKVLKKTN